MGAPMSTVFVIALAGLAWVVICAIVVGLCMAARQGDAGLRPAPKAVRLRRARQRGSRPRLRSAR